jgi:ubiquinone/menaquinone biosynthesis C-methylase UbiE
MNKEISFPERHAPSTDRGLNYLLRRTQLTSEELTGQKILNVGSGLTDLQRDLLKRGVNDTSVVSLDLAYDPVRKHWWWPNKISRHKIPQNAIRGDFKQLPFSDNSFDTAFVSWSVIPWIQDYEVRLETLSEVMRVAQQAFILPVNNKDYSKLYASAFPSYGVNHIKPHWYMTGALHLIKTKS